MNFLSSIINSIHEKGSSYTLFTEHLYKALYGDSVLQEGEEKEGKRSQTRKFIQNYLSQIVKGLEPAIPALELLQKKFNVFVNGDDSVGVEISVKTRIQAQYPMLVGGGKLTKEEAVDYAKNVLKNAKNIDRKILQTYVGHIDNFFTKKDSGAFALYSVENNEGTTIKSLLPPPSNRSDLQKDGNKGQWRGGYYGVGLNKVKNTKKDGVSVTDSSSKTAYIKIYYTGSEAHVEFVNGSKPDDVIVSDLPVVIGSAKKDYESIEKIEEKIENLKKQQKSNLLNNIVKRSTEELNRKKERFLSPSEQIDFEGINIDKEAGYEKEDKELVNSIKTTSLYDATKTIIAKKCGNIEGFSYSQSDSEDTSAAHTVPSIPVSDAIFGPNKDSFFNKIVTADEIASKSSNSIIANLVKKARRQAGFDSNKKGYQYITGDGTESTYYATFYSYYGEAILDIIYKGIVSKLTKSGSTTSFDEISKNIGKEFETTLVKFMQKGYKGDITSAGHSSLDAPVYSDEGSSQRDVEDPNEVTDAPGDIAMPEEGEGINRRTAIDYLQDIKHRIEDTERKIKEVESDRQEKPGMVGRSNYEIKRYISLKTKQLEDLVKEKANLEERLKFAEKMYADLKDINTSTDPGAYFHHEIKEESDKLGEVQDSRNDANKKFLQLITNSDGRLVEAGENAPIDTTTEYIQALDNNIMILENEILKKLGMTGIDKLYFRRANKHYPTLLSPHEKFKEEVSKDLQVVKNLRKRASNFLSALNKKKDEIERVNMRANESGISDKDESLVDFLLRSIEGADDSKIFVSKYINVRGFKETDDDVIAFFDFADNLS